jgi:hypothetical protein
MPKIIESQTPRWLNGIPLERMVAWAEAVEQKRNASSRVEQSGTRLVSVTLPSANGANQRTMQHASEERQQKIELVKTYLCLHDYLIKEPKFSRWYKAHGISEDVIAEVFEKK